MFEVVRETIDGVDMKVYKQRLRSLREVAAIGKGRGDAETYLVYGDRRYGFGEFVRLANSVSSHLASDCGIVHGDRVAVLSANNPEWVLTFWGTVNLGAILVGLNGWWKTDEIVYGLNDSGSRVLVADRERFRRVAGTLGSIPGLEVVYLIDADPGGHGATNADDKENKDKRIASFAELIADPTPDLPTTPIDEADAAVIFYTSGTTGRAKGAISTHRSMIANLQNTVYNAVAGSMLIGGAPVIGGTGESGGTGGGVAHQTASLATSPLFHVSGCHSGIVVAMLGGVKQVMPVGRFDPEEAMRLIEAERVSVWGTVPTMVWRVVEHPHRDRYDLSSVHTVAYGGSPSARELQRQVQATFPNVKTMGNAYGLTESSSVATVNAGQDLLDKPESVGLPMPVVEVRIAGAHAEALPPGQIGEVWIKGPIIMPGYWGNPGATAETLTDGWLHTGDLGFLDPEGFLYITDRVKDMIIRGGENIYCAEIENRLLEHPLVMEAAVIGVAHRSLGEEVKAVVRTVPGTELTPREVQEWVAETLANFKVPAYVELTHEKLPRNASGKLLKNVLRGEAEAGFAETM